MRKRIVFLLCLPFLLPAQDKVDLYVMNRIKAEAFQDSKVMDHAFYLTDVYGPRLTGSPQLQSAAEWVVKRLNEYGLVNTALEKWGPFGRGWGNLRFSASLKEPQYAPLIGVALPWSPGTNGVVRGEPVLAVLQSEADLEKYKGKLKGKIVLLQEPRPVLPLAEALMKRYSDTDLAQEALAPDPGQRGPSVPPALVPGAPPRRAGVPFDREAMRRFRNQRNQFLHDEGVLVTLIPSIRTDGGTIFAGPAGSQDPKDPVPPPAVALTAEHYDRIARLIEKKIPVTLEFDIENKFYDQSPDSFTVVGEIPGTSKPDEVVMLGGHLDSWTFGTGATDNASGCSVAVEAMRILKALDLHMPRTVRLALWTGEEQGLLGSRAYVKAHFADPQDMQLKPEHAKLSGYFNLDNGTGKIRGVYLQGNDMMRPVFESWLAPFRDLGVSTVTIRNTGSTDHVSFDAVGLPGFQFIQDPDEYGTRTHHSNMDVYDHLIAGDLMQASAVMAAVVYDAAVRDAMLPRKPLPKPQPRRERRGVPVPSGN